MGKKIDRIPKYILEKMIGYDWPGNIRELEHLIERSVILTSGNTLAINDQLLTQVYGENENGGAAQLRSLHANERDHICHVLKLTKWKIEGPGGAAAILDIHPSTLRFRLKKLGIKRPS